MLPSIKFLSMNNEPALYYILFETDVKSIYVGEFHLYQRCDQQFDQSRVFNFPFTNNNASPFVLNISKLQCMQLDYWSPAFAVGLPIDLMFICEPRLWRYILIHQHP